MRLLEDAGFARVRGEDISAELLRIHVAELERLPASGLDPRAAETLGAAWRAKIARIERGEVTASVIAALEPIYVRPSDAEINYPDGFPSAARHFS